MLYFAKDQNEEKSPMLTQFTMHFNNVSQWTKVVLLKKGVDMKARSKLMMHFIAIMKVPVNMCTLLTSALFPNKHIIIALLVKSIFNKRTALIQRKRYKNEWVGITSAPC